MNNNENRPTHSFSTKKSATSGSGMSMSDVANAARRDSGAISSDAQKTLTDTYRLLSWSILFSAFTATLSATVMFPIALAMVSGMGGLLVILGVYWFTLFMVSRNSRSPSGVLWVFALTGWLGFTMGPLLATVVAVNGFGPIINSLATTGLIFLGTSWLGKANPGILKLGSFLMIGILVAFVISLVNVFFLQIPILAVVISAVFAVISAGLIAWQTAAIVHGGERNYIMATVTLFVMLYNLFSILLHLFASRD